MTSTKQYFEKNLNGLLGNTQETPSGCLEWQGAKNNAGYGHVWWFGKYKAVTRLIVELSGNKIPEGEYACHTCDNPKCINPNHLFVATNRDNIKDAQAKGRKKTAKHGTRAKYVGGCKCVKCKRAESDYARMRRGIK